MAKIIDTSHNAAGNQTFAGDWAAAWTIQSDGSEKTSADDPGIFPLAKDYESEVGSPDENDFDCRGDNYPHDGNRTDKVVFTFMDVSEEAIKLAAETLKGEFVRCITQENRDPIDGKIIYRIYPRCRVSNVVKIKKPGNTWQMTLTPLPVLSDYDGISADQATKLNALEPPPGQDLAENDGAVDANETFATFSKTVS